LPPWPPCFYSDETARSGKRIRQGMTENESVSQ
jgi:hypothetical protein